MEEELSPTGIATEWVVGTDGGQLSPDEWAQVVDAEAQARSPHWIIPGLVGCALSHLDAYRRIIASGEPAALVLEDDAVLPEQLPQLLAALEPQLTGAEVALLHYKSTRPCQFSDFAAVDLPGEARLLYPISTAPLVAATAYVITSVACERFLDFMLPIRVGPDSWGHFFEHGVVERVRCVAPRAVDARADFKSTIDYLGDSASLRQRLVTAVARRRIWPLYQLLAKRRARSAARMSDFTVVSDPPPYLNPPSEGMTQADRPGIGG
jgi:hypothetical protein